ncbi:hypothetical protein EDM53_02270 [Rickettsiales endosymbiont of Peranema trichophorum]|uniref:hypothetical protein n=1 Tax=Rickettsiales endosymbiont of Peranema trichophorum TaxID=2486577 RepID=UPI001022A871|nr:hypothetical protein [Rickettsiales endosymbiont of Peranema trichophorum]RZI47363.1 hypothetical protein EDM53_02270 [Rickettsiales endosymbiont of Peranema trichophorum]
MVIKLDVAEIDMNFMKHEKLEEHLTGFKGFAYNHVSQGIDLSTFYLEFTIYKSRLGALLIQDLMTKVKC